jgi:DNA-directed RNA polymerase subunit omega
MLRWKRILSPQANPRRLALNFSCADRLEEKVGNKYSLVIVTAKRARQLKEGAMPMVESTSENVLSMAMDEVAVDKIIPIAPPDVEEREALALAGNDDASSAAVLLAGLGGDLELDEETEALLADDEEEEEEAVPLLLSTDDDTEEPEAEATEEEEASEEEAEEE